MGPTALCTVARRPALLMREFERLPSGDGLLLSRVTYEFMRPVPVGELEVHAEVVRPGRRVQLLEGSIAAGGVEVVRARALQVQAADAQTAAVDDTPPPPGPEHGGPRELRAPHRPMFAPDAIEIRFVGRRMGGRARAPPGFA